MNSLILCLDGGNVLRYHTYAHTHRQQTVAEHSFRAYHVAMYITNGTLPVNVVHELLHHDIAEAYTGDVPYPVKNEQKDLKTVLRRLEREVRDQNGLTWKLSARDQDFCKLCDMLEMGLYGCEQVEAGNVRYRKVVDNVLNFLDLTEQEWCELSKVRDLYHHIRVRGATK